MRNELEVNFCDAFGGADAAHGSFSDMQKAVNYAMTSFFTTGGIRGGKKKGFEKFHPRSFNMGVSAEVYKKLDGFSNMRYGEDIDFSIRIFKAGYSIRLFPNAYVYHKRRTDLRKFYRQVFHSGEARIVLRKRHPGSLKVVHLLPSVFVVGNLLLLLAAAAGFALAACFAGCVTISLLCLAPVILYALMIFIDAAIRNKSVKIGAMSVIASYIQLTGYGLGMIVEFLTKSTSKKKQEELYK